MSEDASTEVPPPPPRWQPLSVIDRRVAGVLVEKAKTTPTAYPMSLNAIITACNQKSNRSPVMNLDADHVERSLGRLRQLGAAGMVEGYGRVTRYRHYLYDWLGVDKVEIAVMAELLLRGAETVGQLRSRAARMEPIRDLSELAPVLQSLKSKGLVVPLTPEGRGHVVTHALYQPQELARLKELYGGPTGERPVGPGLTPEAIPAAPAPPPPPTRLPESIQQELASLRAEVAQLRSDLEALSESYHQTDREFHRLKEELGA